MTLQLARMAKRPTSNGVDNSSVEMASQPSEQSFEPTRSNASDVAKDFARSGRIEVTQADG